MDGNSATLTTTVGPQDGQIRFVGLKDQRINVEVTGATMGRPWLNLRAPSGAAVARTTLYNGDQAWGVITLPEAGEYTIDIDSLLNTAGTLTVRVVDVPPDPAATVTVDGDSTTLATTVGTQWAHVQFDGTQGQRINIQFTGVTMARPWIGLYAPSGVQAGSITLYNGDQNWGIVTLPETGTYRLDIDSVLDGAGAVTVQMITVPADPQATVSVDGAPASLTTTVGSQSAHLQFEATKDQRINFDFTNVTMGRPYMALKAPSGAQVGTVTLYNGDQAWGPLTLPETGTYHLDIDSVVDVAGTVTAKVTTAPPDPTATATIDGPAVTVATTVGGQWARVDFSGQSEQRIKFEFTGVTMGRPWMRVRTASGAQVASTTLYNGDETWGLITLPTTGAYSVDIDSMTDVAGRVTVKIITVPLISDGKPVIASSSYSGGLAAANAVDNDTRTRWSSDYSDPQWIYVDLGDTATISRVRLNWETSFGSAYRIETSSDTSTWTTVYYTAQGDGGIDDITGLNATGRYVRMYGIARGFPAGYSLWEFEVYGSFNRDPLISTGRPTTASTSYSGSYASSYAVDQNMGSRWSSDFSDPQWIYIDLGQTATITRVRLNWETSFGSAYRIETSDDATNWTTVYATNNGDGGIDDIAGLNATGRYVRMYGTARGFPAGYSLWEFEVRGTLPPIEGARVPNAA